jgi:hypothetical protein
MDSSMRIVYVWLTAIAVCFVLTVGWYVCNDVVTAIVQGSMGDLAGKALSLTSLVEYVAIAWGPILDIIVIIWAIVSSQATDPISGYR